MWRIIAIVDSSNGPRVRKTRTSGAVVIGLGLVVLLTHAWAGYVAWAFYNAGQQGVYVADSGPDATSVPASAAPGATEPGPSTSRRRSRPPRRSTERINILLTGVDTEETRQTELTDSLIVASVDPVTSDVALISFPRDISNFKLFDGRTFTGKINGFMQLGAEPSEGIPGRTMPSRARSRSSASSLGAPIHYYAALDLAGFRKMIDAVGGVTVDDKRRPSTTRATTGWTGVAGSA